MKPLKIGINFRGLKFFTLVACLAFLASLALSGPLPPIRSYPQLNEEAKIWIEQLESVMKSGEIVKVMAKGEGGLDRLREILGPYVPVEKVRILELRPDGSFSVHFIKEHVIDLPTDDPKGENKYIRVTVHEGVLKGKLIESKTYKKGLPVKVLAFTEPQTISLDTLNAKRESTVPGVAKMLGLLPKIIALVCHQGDKGCLVAPQLNGMGTSENPRLMKDLLFMDDTLFPETLTKS